MTTLYPKVVSCVICGTENEVFHLASTNSFGSPDLDYRPAGMARYTLIYEVQTCVKCGFSAADISNNFKEILSGGYYGQKSQLNEIKELITSEVYKNILNNESFPKFSNSFLAASAILEKIEKFNSAFFMAIKSAWIADDNSNINAAKYSREKAFELIDKTTHDFIDNTIKLLLKIELLRRTARFEEADKLIDEALVQLNADDRAVRILSFQNKLIIKKDSAAHRIDEGVKV